MRHLFDLIAANPALFATLAALLLSELAPFLPTQWNGMIHAVVVALKKKGGAK